VIKLPISESELIQAAQAMQPEAPELSARQTFNCIIGYRIRQSRESLGWEQKRLAEYLRISQSALSRIELGQSEISVYQLNQLSEVLPHFATLTFSNRLYKVFK
jgi:ribosome-binding protein aMBF1 (putative translation factor)